MPKYGTKSASISGIRQMREARALPAVRCHYCSRLAQTIDHIIPISKGGPKGAQWNRVPACLRCNRRKRDEWPTCECRTCQQALTLFNSY